MTDGNRNFNFVIPRDLDDRLKDESKRSGVPMSVMVRRAVDLYLTFNVDSGRTQARQMAPTGAGKDEVG